jgi:hypothetical protein
MWRDSRSIHPVLRDPIQGSCPEKLVLPHDEEKRRLERICQVELLVVA